MKNLFGFSWTGFLIVLFPMVPNLFYYLFPNKLQATKHGANHSFLNLLEHSNQFIFIGLLICVPIDQSVSINSGYVIAIALFLFSYYGLWIFLFKENTNLFILICMAILPVCYFTLAEIWLHSFFAILPTLIFGAVHVLITYLDFYQS